MGLFDAVRSMFGGQDEERDASTEEAADAEAAATDEAESEPDAPAEQAVPGGDREEGEAAGGDDEPERDGDREESGDAEQGPDAAAEAEPDQQSTGGPGNEIVGDADDADDISEWTFDDTGDDAADDADDAADDADDAADDADDSAEEEPVSWEETGFEQLTTELVDEEEDAEDDPADLITEAEPDRATAEPSAESDTLIDEAERDAPADADNDTAGSTAERGAAGSARGSGAPAGESDRASGGGPAADDRDAHLPLSEGVTEESAGEPGPEIPEDSPRADFVEEAVDLAEFWGEYDLDFTVASLARLDELIADHWDPERFAEAEFGGEGYDSEVFTEQVRRIGSYVGEVLVRAHGGEWIEQDGVGWTVDVQAGPDVDAAGATVTVFHIAQSALRGEASVAARHDGVAEQLDLEDRVGVEEPTATLQQAGGHTEPESADEDVIERFRAGAEDLADRWPDYDLDFSTASLARLEELLEDQLDGERFEDVELGNENDRDSLLLTAHVVGVGGYLAEVLRREHDATWATDGALIVVVESGGERHEVDPIEAALECIRGERSLTDVAPATE